MEMTDSLSVNDLIKKISPDEIYNLAAQSHVKVSFEVQNILQKLMLLELANRSDKVFKINS